MKLEIVNWKMEAGKIIANPICQFPVSNFQFHVFFPIEGKK